MGEQREALRSHGGDLDESPGGHGELSAEGRSSNARGLSDTAEREHRDTHQGVVVAMAATQQQASHRADLLKIDHPMRCLMVRDGGARWASKGGRWLVVCTNTGAAERAVLGLVSPTHAGIGRDVCASDAELAGVEADVARILVGEDADGVLQEIDDGDAKAEAERARRAELDDEARCEESEQRFYRQEAAVDWTWHHFRNIDWRGDGQAALWLCVALAVLLPVLFAAARGFEAVSAAIGAR